MTMMIGGGALVATSLVFGAVAASKAKQVEEKARPATPASTSRSRSCENDRQGGQRAGGPHRAGRAGGRRRRGLLPVVPFASHGDTRPRRRCFRWPVPGWPGPGCTFASDGQPCDALAKPLDRCSFPLPLADRLLALGCYNPKIEEGASSAGPTTPAPPASAASTCAASSPGRPSDGGAPDTGGERCPTLCTPPTGSTGRLRSGLPDRLPLDRAVLEQRRRATCAGRPPRTASALYAACDSAPGRLPARAGLPARVHRDLRVPLLPLLPGGHRLRAELPLRGRGARRCRQQVAVQDLQPPRSGCNPTGTSPSCGAEAPSGSDDSLRFACYIVSPENPTRPCASAPAPSPRGSPASGPTSACRERVHPHRQGAAGRPLPAALYPAAVARHPGGGLPEPGRICIAFPNTNGIGYCR